MSTGLDSQDDKREVGRRRHIRKTGNSLAVMIPPWLLEVVGLQRDDPVEVVRRGESDVLEIRPVEDDD